MTAMKERTPLDKLLPASLVPHYKFSPQAMHLTDAVPDNYDLVSMQTVCTASLYWQSMVESQPLVCAQDNLLTIAMTCVPDKPVCSLGGTSK